MEAILCLLTLALYIYLIWRKQFPSEEKNKNYDKRSKDEKR